MFKARGTRIIFEDDASPAPMLPPARVPDQILEPDFQPEKPVSDVNGNFGSSPALLALPEVREHNDEQAADLAAMMGMGFPTLPPDFKRQLLAARAGDLDAIALMRKIGEQVPQHLQMGFMEMVHDLLNEGDA